MAMYVYGNSFHGTEIKSHYSPDALDAIDYRIYNGTATDAEKALARRYKRKLCGMQDCCCSGRFGIRA